MAILMPILAVACATPSRPPTASPHGACERPYSDGSPWNRPIGPTPRYDPESAFHVAAVHGSLTSDPTQYTYPVYPVTGSTPLVDVALSGWYSNVVDGGRALESQRAGTARLPIPAGSQAAAEEDAQIILLDEAGGDEWGLSHLRREPDGTWSAWNAYHYSVRWDAVPPHDAQARPFFPRGAGVPYLAGLVRPCEIRRGRIDHALAFAYDYPTAAFVGPATKSDGIGKEPGDMPEGARLQLDPKLTEAQIEGWGCAGACLTVARALQEYGMYIIDNAGRPKVMFEYESTAHWNGAVTAQSVSPIHVDALRLIGG